MPASACAGVTSGAAAPGSWCDTPARPDSATNVTPAITRPMLRGSASHELLLTHGRATSRVEVQCNVCASSAALHAWRSR